MSSLTQVGLNAKALVGFSNANGSPVVFLQWFRTQDSQFKELYVVVQVVLPWGLQWTGCHVVFHIDNEVIFDAIASDHNCLWHTMLCILLMIAVCLDFSFLSEWLPSAENALAASRFQYTQLFQLAPYLPNKP